MEIIYKDCPTCKQSTTEPAGFKVTLPTAITVESVRRIISHQFSALDWTRRLRDFYPGLSLSEAKGIIDRVRELMRAEEGGLPQ